MRDPEGPHAESPHAHRRVARRDARLEGEPDVEDDAAAPDASR